jgi:hypothetical protein
MRTELLVTLALLCGTAAVHAQQWPANASGNYQGYAPYYPMVPRGYGYNGYPQYAGYPQAAAAYPGYNSYPYAAPNNSGYAYPRSAAVPSGTTSPAAPAPQATASAAAPAPPATTKPTPGTSAPAKTGGAPDPAPAGSPASGATTPAVPHDPEAGPPALGHLPFQRDGCDTFWVTAVYNLAWIRDGRLPGPLVTTGMSADPAFVAAVGQPGTAVAFGQNLRFDVFSGMQMEAGLFLDDSDRLSLDVNGIWLYPSHIHFRTASDATGAPVIGIPFLNIVTSEFGAPVTPTPFEDATLVSRPGFIAGNVVVDAKTDLWGIEFNGRYHVYGQQSFHGDVLVGVRYLHLKEDLTTQSQLQPLAAAPFTLVNFLGQPVNAPDSLVIQDNFGTANDFYGMQVGGRARWEEEHFFVSVFAKVAAGATEEHVNIAGSTTLVTAAGNQVAQGGVLALPSNIGSRTRTVFGLVPEFGGNLGADLIPHVRLTTGYSFLLWNRVVRPGGQIDRAVNSGQIPEEPEFGMTTGAGNPFFTFKDERFWVHNFKAGLEFYY